MTIGKRLFDIGFALILGLLLAPVMGFVSLVILLRDGRPIIYRSERMRAPDRAFQLIKFRTMTESDTDRGVSGGDKECRITKTGRLLRRTRLDELPQLWNILKGDMSFVGPRPPLRLYVERFPGTYKEVLHSRPGVTGLATLLFHAHEERILAECQTEEQTDLTYARRCVPRKARLDLIYQKKRTLCFDVEILLSTLISAAQKVGR